MSAWEDIWAKLEPAMALNGHTHSEADIVDGLRSGEFQLWASENAAMLTEYVHFPRAKWINIFLVGGDMEELLEVLPNVEKYGKMTGCDKIACIGRVGFERVLKDYTKIAVVLKKDLH